jgi:uncharacterized repeat protein (TIGR03803 family)
MRFARLIVVMVAGMALCCFTVPAQILTALHNFDFSESAPIPAGRPVLAGGTLYGVTGHGGSNDAGIVYAVNLGGTGFAVLHDFSIDTNGGAPEGGLLLSGDTLYGTTSLGGTNGPWGTVFSMKTNGTGFNVLHSFTSDPTVGQHPHPRLTMDGGIQPDGNGFNSFYMFTTPHGSPLTNVDGEQPQGALIPFGGLLYGTAYGGGPAGYPNNSGVITGKQSLCFMKGLS